MASLFVVCKKELADHLGSKRFLLVSALILALSLFSAYQATESLRDQSSNIFVQIFSQSSSGYSFISIMVMFGPLIGLALGFDAINRERTSGSLSVILSQPLFRDSIINGKFLAGVGALALLTISTIGIMTGIAIPLLGFGPSPDQIVRIVFFTLITILYLSVWLAIGILFSTLTKKTTTAMLASVSTWFFSALVITMLASVLASVIIPTNMPSGGFGVSQTSDGRTTNTTITTSSGIITGAEAEDFLERMEEQNALEMMLRRISPSILYQEAGTSILGEFSPVFMSFSVISFGSGAPERDILSNWPQMVVLAVVLVVCFAVSYIVFLRQEIRVGN